MSEADAVERAERPATVDTLVADLRRLGVAAGSTVMVHSSLSRLGFVAGGPQAVVAALVAAVGPTGTLMMPTHSGHLSDPSGWRNPPVPEWWWPAIREHTPAYDPRLTPTRAMGAIVDCFRGVPGVLRSAHPTVSAAAVGPDAGRLVGDHPLAHGLGESSPQARLYDLDGWVLLLGVDHGNDTSLHLAEYRADWPSKPWTTQSSPVLVDGERRWMTYDELEPDEDDFARLGEDFAATGRERSGPVAAGTGRLCRVREVVDFAVGWLAQHRADRTPT